MSLKVITASEKIRNLRKKYSFSQEDLSGETINRTLISYIENRKINLSEKTAKLIVENVNKLSIDRNLGLEIGLSDIMADVNEQVRGITDQFIVELEILKKNKKVIAPERLREIEEFLHDKNVPKRKGLVYELVGDSLLNAGETNLNRVFEYYIRAFEQKLLMQKTGDETVLKIVLKIAYNRNQAKDYVIASKYLKRFIDIMDKGINDSRHLYLIYFYLGNAYAGMNKHEAAISEHKKALKLVTDGAKTSRAQIVVNIGQCYSALKQYSTSMRHLQAAVKMFESNKDISNYCLALSDMIDNIICDEFITNQDKRFQLDLLAGKLLVAVTHLSANDTSLYRGYTELSRIYYCLNKDDEAKKYLKMAVQSAIDTNQVRKMSIIVLRTYEIIKAYKLADVLFDENSIKVLCGFGINSEYLRDTVFALMSCLSDNKNYEMIDSIIKNVIGTMERPVVLKRI